MNYNIPEPTFQNFFLISLATCVFWNLLILRLIPHIYNHMSCAPQDVIIFTSFPFFSHSHLKLRATVVDIFTIFSPSPHHQVAHRHLFHQLP